ncbi:MAG TPA: hypothetical protein VL461_03565 [Dictyobacter sp.]|jgi:hypothetical protein|nr:hypothetical protein [Dictyobacter sp.]
MPAPEHSIFREKALEKYLRSQEQSVLLRVVVPPVGLFVWILLLLFVVAGVLVWAIQVPIYVTEQGILVEPQASGQQQNQVEAVLFLPANQQANFHQGQTVSLQTGPTMISMVGSIAQVQSQIISPADARSQFHLQGALAQIVTGPSVIVIVRLTSDAPANVYAGSLCAARIQIGSQSVLSLLPVVNQLIK